MRSEQTHGTRLPVGQTRRVFAQLFSSDYCRISYEALYARDRGTSTRVDSSITTHWKALTKAQPQLEDRLSRARAKRG